MVGFDVGAEAYGRFMGRFSEPLATLFAELAGVHDGQRALDVGCGPGALTAALIARLGSSAVAAADPSVPFVAAARERFPDVDVQLAPAEALPFPDEEFDVVLAQLVVQFMTDPVAGLAEMKRVAKPGSLVSACIWDHGTGRGPLSPFWQAVQVLDPEARDESAAVGANDGDLVGLFERAGLRQVAQAVLTVRVPFATFDDWWEPFTFGVGPAGAYVATLDPESREAVRAECERVLPVAPFSIEASAWTGMGHA